MALNTRKPTGVVPWPLVLIEGGEKTGKSYACAVLSASGKIGRTLWLDWGEGAADEYGAVPGARYEVIEHDGTWASIMGQVIAAKEEAQRAKDAGEPPVVLILDSITAEWESLKDWASARAKTQRANREKIQRDPNAEVNVSMNLWNDAAGRHRKLMTQLMTFPGIVIATARGGETALVENGKPVEGKKSYRVEGHKSLAFDASCWIRLSRDTKPIVVGARSVHAGVRPGIDPAQTLAKDWSLEWLIFDVLKCNPATAHVRNLAEPTTDILTPEQIRDEALETTTTFERIKELHAIAEQHHRDVILVNGSGDEEPLVQMLHRIGLERRDGGSVQRPHARPAAVTGKVTAAPAPPRQAATDEDAQVFADKAHKARVPAEIEAIHRQAREAGKVASLIRNPASGGTGKLAVYLDWKRQQLLAAQPAGLDADDPWAAKVEEITEGDYTAAREALEEAARMLGSGEIDAEHYARIEAAIEARFPKDGGEAQVAA